MNLENTWIFAKAVDASRARCSSSTSLSIAAYYYKKKTGLYRLNENLKENYQNMKISKR